MEINRIPEEDRRVQEKFVSRGVVALDDSELLSLIIGRNAQSASAIETAREIIAGVGGSWQRLAQTEWGQLRNRAQLGAVRAAAVLAALELGRRYRAQLASECDRIASMRDAETIFRPLIADLPYEEFWAVYLSSAGKILQKKRISHGGVNATAVDIRLILKGAIERLATGILLVHNHPSGNATPSSEDLDITRRLAHAAQFFDLTLTDHLIVASSGCYSFRNEGLLE